ncbi:hypothetical protein ABFG93_04680 [Pseudalkalibacillus hwajinpoensis]|uniref:hypothetical protein n=1 Tax=Guptibacillus hwajinpoensis TaxID=208199 RepID=UPI00325B4608
MKNYLYFVISFIILFFCLQIISGIIFTVPNEQQSSAVIEEYASAENSFVITAIVIFTSAILAFVIQRWLVRKKSI